MLLIFLIFFNFSLNANETASSSLIDFENNSLNLIEEKEVIIDGEIHKFKELIPIGVESNLGASRGIEFYPQISFKPLNVLGNIKVEEIEIEWQLFDGRNNIIPIDYNKHMQVKSVDKLTPIEAIKFQNDTQRKNHFFKRYLSNNVEKNTPNQGEGIPYEIKIYNGLNDEYKPLINKPQVKLFENINNFIIDITNRFEHGFYIKKNFKDFSTTSRAVFKISELEGYLNNIMNVENKTQYDFSNVNSLDNYKISFPIFISRTALNFRVNHTLKIIVKLKYNKGMHTHTHSIVFGKPNDLKNLNLLVIAESSSEPYNLGIKNLDNELEFDNQTISKLINGVEVQKLNKRNRKIYVSKPLNENLDLQQEWDENCKFLITKEQNNLTERIENEQIVFKAQNNEPLSHAKFYIKIIKKVGETTLTLASSTLRVIIIRGNQIIAPVLKKYRPVYFKYLSKYYGVDKNFKLIDIKDDFSVILEDISLINNSDLKYKLTVPEVALSDFQILSNCLNKEDINRKNYIGSNKYEITNMSYSENGRSNSIKMTIDSNRINLKNPYILEKNLEENEQNHRKILIKGLSVNEDSADKKEIKFEEDNEEPNFKEVEVSLDTNIEIIESEVFNFNLPITYKVRNYYEINYNANKDININYKIHEDLKPSGVILPIITREEEGQQNRLIGYENLINKGLISYSADSKIFNFVAYEDEKLNIKVDISASEIEFPEDNSAIFRDNYKDKIEYIDNNESFLKFTHKIKNLNKSNYKALGTKNKLRIKFNNKEDKENEIDEDFFYLFYKEDKYFTFKDAFLKYFKDKFEKDFFELSSNKIKIDNNEFEVEIPKECLKFQSGYGINKWDKREVEIWCHPNEKEKKEKASREDKNWRAYSLSFSVNRIHLKFNDLYFTKMTNSQYSHECFIDGIVFRKQKLYSKPSGIKKELDIVVRTIPCEDIKEAQKVEHYITNKNFSNLYFNNPENNEGTLFLFDENQVIENEPLDYFYGNLHNKIRIPLMIKVGKVESISFEGKDIKNVYSSKETSRGKITHGIRKDNNSLAEIEGSYNPDDYIFLLDLEDKTQSVNDSKSYTYIRKTIPLKYKLGFCWEYFDSKNENNDSLKIFYKNATNTSISSKYLVENKQQKAIISLLDKVTSEDLIRDSDELKRSKELLNSIKNELKDDEYLNIYKKIEEYFINIENFSTNAEETEERDALKKQIEMMKSELNQHNLKILKPNENTSSFDFCNKALNSQGNFEEKIDFEDLNDGIALNEQKPNIFILDLNNLNSILPYKSFTNSVIENNLKIVIFPMLEENEKFDLMDECKFSEKNKQGAKQLDQNKVAIRTIPIYVLPQIKPNIIAPENAIIKGRIDIKVYNDFAHDQFEKEEGTRRYKIKENNYPSFKLEEEKKYWKIDEEIKSKYNIEPIIFLKELNISSDKVLNFSEILEKITKLRKSVSSVESNYDGFENLTSLINKIFNDFFKKDDGNSKDKEIFDIKLSGDNSFIIISFKEEANFDNRSEPFEYIKILLRNCATYNEKEKNNEIIFYPIGVEIKNLLINYDYFKKEINIKSETSIELNEEARKNKKYKFEPLKNEKKINLNIPRIRRQ